MSDHHVCLTGCAHTYREAREAQKVNFKTIREMEKEIFNFKEKQKLRGGELISPENEITTQILVVHNAKVKDRQNNRGFKQLCQCIHSTISC